MSEEVREPTEADIKALREKFILDEDDVRGKPSPFCVGLTLACAEHGCEEMIDDVLDEGEIFNDTWVCDYHSRTRKDKELKLLREKVKLLEDNMSGRCCPHCGLDWLGGAMARAHTLVCHHHPMRIEEEKNKKLIADNERLRMGITLALRGEEKKCREVIDAVYYQVEDLYVHKDELERLEKQIEQMRQEHKDDNELLENLQEAMRSIKAVIKEAGV